MKSILASVDDQDTRREVAYLFSILPPVERVAFLYKACDMLGPIGMSPKGEGVFLTITNETGDYRESVLDFWAMVSQYGLDVQRALAELERRASQFTKPGGIIELP